MDLIETILVVPYHNNRAIVFRRKKEPFIGRYCPVAEHLNQKESSGSAAVRKLYEELYSNSNLSARDIVSLYSRHEFKLITSLEKAIQGENYRIRIYSCKVGDPSEFKLSDEVEDSRYIDEVDLLELDDVTREILQSNFL